jgi:CRP-like cAMP-binding protein
MFGMVAVIDKGGRSASCVTAGPARLFKLEQEEFDLLFQTGNRFAYTMVDMVARQLVEHIRGANAMLPPPGQGPARPIRRPVDPRPKQPQIMDPVGAAAGEEELEVLPLYLEL